ncbi:MAG: anti-sigma factor family protein [Candidatus Rokuibacteriota bacterium]
MSCREAIDLLADYLEATMTPASLARLEAHLRECAPCRAYLATYKRAAELAAKVNRVEMPPEIRRRLRDFLSDRPGSTP